MNTLLPSNISTQSNISIPAAPLVWEAIAYAHERVPFGLKLTESVNREDLLEEHLVAWLVASAQDDITFLGQFALEFDDLRIATQIALYGEDLGCFDWVEYSALWLILQGEDAHQTMIGMPAFYRRLDDEYDFSHEMYPVADARGLMGLDPFGIGEDPLGTDAL